MRAIESATVFKRDLKKLRANPNHASIDALLASILNLLEADKLLPAKYRDHALTGLYKGYRDCHIKPDVVLIYSKPDKDTLWLARIGSHSEVF
jgi:mRNA interferase YafQ